jgi:DNA-directed RNA polymerase beta subunit
MVAVAHHREAVKSTEWPALVQALHHHYPAFHTVPSLAPELMRLSHRLLNTNAESEEEKQIESILARAVDMELENLTLPQTELAFNGETGEQIFIFIGPTHLWSLPKIATDLMKSRSTGPVHFLSGQPAATSDGQGAGRWGRMELQALAAAGAAGIIQTTTSSHSDHFVADLCEHCGLNYAYNHVENTGYCANCKRTATGQHKTVRSSQISTEALRIAGMHRIPVIRRSDPDKEEHLNA